MARVNDLSLDDLAEVLANGIRDATASLRERIVVLESRLMVQETKSAAVGVRWRGTYHDGDVVAAGELVTCGGSLWLARRTTNARPGHSPDDFVLVVKRGELDR
jgi:hypothetical protein